MPCPIHPAAEREIEEAALYYDGCWLGLGDDFLAEFEATLLRILERPTRWPVYHGKARKLNLHRFPYAIVYEILKDSIHILAIIHLRRRPFYWADRSSTG